jgi:DNA-binding response OmpR family regulator
MKQKILLVDDDSTLLELISKRVTEAGFEVFVASDGAECLSCIERIEPALIVLDVQMPGMTGYETCTKIRDESNFSKIPIIFLTGNESDWDLIEGYAQGCSSYLVKPLLIDKTFTDILIKEIEEQLSKTT